MATYSNRALLLALFSLLLCCVHGQLSNNFYQNTCPNVETIVRSVMAQALAKEPRMGASILRLFFHDCFVQGCDASILLDDTPMFIGEKNAAPNANSARGYEVIDAIKAQVEASCHATVSCADILALAARDGVNLLGGPTWNVPLGRRDSRTASQTAAITNLPGPGSNLATLVSMFGAQGFTASEMTVLSGAHTIGEARCQFLRNPTFSEANIDSSFATLKQQTCPQTGNENNLAPMDVQSPTTFDNAYYVNLINRKGFFHSDQELYNGGSQDKVVEKYSTDAAHFAKDFGKAMVKMAKLSPSIGNNGEIRLNCRMVN